MSPGRYTLMAVNDAARWMAEISSNAATTSRPADGGQSVCLVNRVSSGASWEIG